MKLVNSLNIFMPIINFCCNYCGKHCTRKVQSKASRRGSTKLFCNKLCFNKERDKRIVCKCANCGQSTKPIPLSRWARPNKVSPNVFCSRSCSATYTNTHKTKCTRRSKLETWLEAQLKIAFPNLIIEYNSKSIIGSELDIYIPSLKLAFELNGLFHYEPIFGQDKLDQIKNNDQRKFAACHEAGISLCVIDTSSHKYVTPKSSQKYLDVILQIVKDLRCGTSIELVPSLSQSEALTN